VCAWYFPVFRGRSASLGGVSPRWRTDGTRRSDFLAELASLCETLGKTKHTLSKTL